MAKGSLSGMLMLDNELAQRIFTPPATKEWISNYSLINLFFFIYLIKTDSNCLLTDL
jgi:hypothetical protein